ncbi:MAG: hypothetical protein R3F34_15990 [Planctomycetota bacterium]
MLDLKASDFDAVLRAWRDERTKVVWDLARSQGRVYDLVADPGEHDGRAIGDLDVPRFADVRRDFRRAQENALEPTVMAPPEAVRAELERLGYLGGD